MYGGRVVYGSGAEMIAAETPMLAERYRAVYGIRRFESCLYIANLLKQLSRSGYEESK